MMRTPAASLLPNIFKVLLLSVLWHITGSVFAQKPIPDARNGWALPPYDRLHVLLIFAEIDYDSTFSHLNPKPAEGQLKWRPGQLPSFKYGLFDSVPGMPQDPWDGYLTKYFRQASFGKYTVTGEFLTEVVTVKMSQVTDKSGKVVTGERFGNNYLLKNVIRIINQRPFRTSNGGTPEAFDRWTLSGAGMPKTATPNGKFDMVMVIWRNANLSGLKGDTGFASRGSVGTIHGHGSDTYSMFGFGQWSPRTIIRHEFSHLLYGGNNFHNSSSGVGKRTFLSPIGGWSNMSNSDRCSHTWNAWDRERMGWQNPENDFLISARCGESGKEVSGELAYGQPLCNAEGVYVLRDFITHGDAIKIKLPHLPTEKQNQYLWLENHQLRKGNFDHEKKMVAGVYAFIQVGKDRLTGASAYGGTNNYTWPLVAAGRYDFRLEPASTKIMLEDERENPFSGHNYLCRAIYDKDQNGRIRCQAGGKSVEGFYPFDITNNGTSYPKEYFNSPSKPAVGTAEMAFLPNKNPKIGISWNPPATPIMNLSSPGARPLKSDNRTIYLNGLSIEVLNIDETGNAYLKIRWDDYDIERNMRWCGDLVCNEKIRLKAGKSILLDQGFSPQLAKQISTLNGEPLFSASTLLEIGPGAELVLEKNAEIKIRRGSGLLVRAGGRLEFGEKARVLVEKDAWIYVEEGAIIQKSGRKSGLFYQESCVGLPQHTEREVVVVKSFAP